MSIRKEFFDFLKEYKIIGMAIAFVMGAAANDLVKSLVNNLVMPFIAPLLPGEAWQTATVTLGPVVLGIGAFTASLLNFLILAWVVFFVFKKLPETGKKLKK